MMIAFYFCLLGTVWARLLETEDIYLTLENVTKFPVYVGKPFDVVFGSNARNEMINQALIDTMVIHVSDPAGLSESAVFDFGFKDSIDSEFSGQFMRIPSWEKYPEKGTIAATIFFNKLANNKSLEIYHISADSSKARRSALKNLKLAKLLYRANISLLIPSSLEMLVNSKNDSVVELDMGVQHNITCEHHGGEPTDSIHLSGLIPRIAVDSLPKKIYSTFKVTPADHGKNLTCTAGKSKKQITVKVLHGPSKIVLETNIGSNFPKGRSVFCRALNGYPTPQIPSFDVLEGPPSPYKFFFGSRDRHGIYFIDETPVGSKWTLQCSIWNMIKGIRHYYYKNTTFTITHKIQSRPASANESQGKRLPSETSKFKKEKVPDKPPYIEWKLQRQGEAIEKLNKNIDKQTREINQLKTGLMKSNSEVSRLKWSMKRLAETQSGQSMKLIKLKQYIDDKILRWKRQSDNSTQKPKSKKDRSEKKSTSKRPFVWKISDVLTLRERKKVVRSKRFYLTKSDRAMYMTAYFDEPRELRLTLRIPANDDMDDRETMKGSLTVTISDEENEEFNTTVKKEFEINSKEMKMDFLFDYKDLVDRQILQSDDIKIKVVSFWNT